MNLNELSKKLIAAARSHPPSDTVPYGFETRIMARLRALPPSDPWAAWAAVLWRAAIPCLAITFFLCAWTLMSSPRPPATDSLTVDLDKTVFAALDNPGDAW